jgi:glutamyl-tRNA synthetase
MDTVYDATLLKSDGFPTYHLAAMVDDLDMKISHILRGHDWLPSTPIHLLVFKYLGGQLPHLGHLTDILSGETGKKLSKRRDSVFVETFLEQGYLPEAMLNYLARLGWSHGDEEIFSMEQFCAWFDLDHLSKSPAQFNPEKLAWINNHYIKLADNVRLAELAKPRMLLEGAQFEQAPDLSAVIALMKERANTINELADAAMLFYRQPAPDAALLA